MPTKTSRKRMRSRGARKEYGTYGGKFSLFDWNFTKQYAAFAIHTLIFRWAPSTWSFEFAIFFFRTFSIEFSANSKMENIEIKRINNCAGVLHPSFFLCKFWGTTANIIFLLFHCILFLEVFVGMNRLKKCWSKICFELCAWRGRLYRSWYFSSF